MECRVVWCMAFTLGYRALRTPAELQQLHPQEVITTLKTTWALLAG